MNKVFVKRVKRKLKTIIETPYRKIKVKNFLQYISAQKRDDEILIVLSPLIGDTCYALAFLREIKKKRTDKSICVAGIKKQQGLLDLYPDIDRIIVLDEKMGKDAELFTFDGKYSEMYLGKDIVNGNAFFYPACYSANNPDIMFQLRTYIYKVGEKAQITYHCSPNSNVSEIEIDTNKQVVILNPYSHSTFEASLTVYEEICNLLKSKGFEVYTNVVGHQKAIKGSYELRCSIENLFCIAQKASMIVSTRSGILDYLAPSNINMFVIYENCSERLKKMYHLSNWECKGEIMEVYPGDKGYNHNDILKDFTIFLENIQGGSI